MKILNRTGLLLAAILSSPVHAVSVQFVSSNPITSPAFYTDFSPLPYEPFLSDPQSFDGFTFDQINGDSNGISTRFGGDSSTRGWYPNGGDFGYTQITLTSGADFGDTALSVGSGGVGSHLAYELLKDSTVVASGTISGHYGAPFHWLTITDGVFDTIRLRDGGSSDIYVGDTMIENALAFDQVATANPVPLNTAPIAVAGSNQSIHVGQVVQLDGSGSYDTETLTEDLIYNWSFDSVPAGSIAAFDLTNPIEPTFIADLPGDYVVSLVATDEGGLSSDPSQLTVSSLNSSPTADAGINHGTYVGNTVVLDGAGSSDPDFDPIVSYVWSFVSQPSGSSAVLSDASTASPTFIPDLPGTYVVQLIVNDGYVDSTPDEVTVTVITGESYAEQKLIEAINAISDMPIESFTKKGNQKQLIKNLEKAIKELQKGNVEKAIKQLEKVVERVDGCALRGSPDDKNTPKIDGKSPKKDHINNCTDQAVIYPLLMDALDALTL